jgi:type IV secretion system protein VirD4
VYLDPFGLESAKSDCFNPFDYIDRDSETSIDDCRDLAESLVIRGQEKEQHWNDGAEIFIAAMSTAIVNFGQPGDRSMQTLRGLLTDPKRMEAAIAAMVASQKWSGILARVGAQLANYKDRELASTLTTAGRFLRFLDTPSIAENTKTSTFDPSELNQGKMTIYLILPPDHMRTQSALLRLWLGAMLRAAVRGGIQESNKVHFLLDEAASLGQMDCLNDALDKYRGYGVRLHFFYQSVSQLKRCWPDGGDQTLLSNTSQVYFGVNDYPTAEYVSNRLGEETITATSWGSSNGVSQQTSNTGDPSTTYSSNSSSNTTQLARKLLKPEEVLALPQRTAITFTPGVPPICTTVIRYYEEKSFVEGWRDAFKTVGKSLGALFMWLVLAGMLALVTNQVILSRLQADQHVHRIHQKQQIQKQQPVVLNPQ